MKFLQVLFFTLLSFSAFSQGTGGFVWKDSAPSYNPGASGAKFVVVTSTYEWYEWVSGTTWRKCGDRVQQISGCSAPAYIPAIHQSRVVVNGCNPIEMYAFRGPLAADWDLIGGGGAGIDTLPNYTTLRSYSGSANAVFIQNFRYVSAPDTFTVVGGLFRRVQTSEADNGGTVISSGSVKWKRDVQNQIWVDWFYNLNAAKRIQKALTLCRSGSTIYFSEPCTYTMLDPFFIDSIQNLTITGNYPVLKRCNSSASTTTLSTAYSGGLSIRVAAVPASWEVGDILVLAKTVKNDDISARTLITGISGTTISIQYVINDQNGALFTCPIGTKVLEDITIIKGRPSATEGALGTQGVNRNIILEKIIFDGNKANNTVALGWSLNSAVSIHGKGSEIRSCVFKNAPNENILGFGLNIHDNYIGFCNGSAFHLSGNDVTFSNTLSNYFTNNTVENCNIVSRDTNGHNEGALSLSWNGGNMSVANNYFKSAFGTDGVIGTVTGSGANDREDIIMTGNRCYGFAGILGGVDASSKPVTIVANLFHNCGSNDYTTLTSVNFRVCGNTISGTTVLNVPPHMSCDPGAWSSNGTKIYHAAGVGIGYGTETTTPLAPLVVSPGMNIGFSDRNLTMDSDSWFTLGTLTDPPSSGGAGVYALRGFSSKFDAPVGSLVFKSMLAANKKMIFATGVDSASMAARISIGSDGNVSYPFLSGTGDGLMGLSSSGLSSRRTLGSGLVFGSGTVSADIPTINYWELVSGNVRRTSGNVAIGIATPTNRLTVESAMNIDYGSADAVATANDVLIFGRRSALIANSYGTGFYSHASGIAGITGGIGNFIIQGNSNAAQSTAGISFVTGAPGVERVFIPKGGGIKVTALAGTGDRIVYATSDGTLGVTGAISLKATATLDFASTAAGTSSDLTITATGAAVGDAVTVAPALASINANTTYSAWVSATDTVTVRFNNYGLVTAIDPASGSFKVIVLKY